MKNFVVSVNYSRTGAMNQETILINRRGVNEKHALESAIFEAGRRLGRTFKNMHIEFRSAFIVRDSKLRTIEGNKNV